MKKIRRKTLLYKSGVEYADFCLNHVEGCSHGCKFPCYAWNMAKRFGKVKNDSDWLEPKLVENALEILEKEIPKYKSQIKFVHLCFMTDPFMYEQPEVTEMTLKIIEKLNSYNIKCTSLTKGIYPQELINERYNPLNEYGITVVSLNNEFKDVFEPGSSPYKDRILGLKYLHDNGLRTWVSMEPYPTPNLDLKQNLKKVLESIKFVDRIVFGKLNYNVESTQWKDNKLYYELAARQVIKFCKENRIDYHIKFGTRQKYDGKTEGLFEELQTATITI